MFKCNIKGLLLTIALAIPSLGVAAPSYVVKEAASGKIVSVGSDTLEKLMLVWSKEFGGYHKGITFDLSAKGSATAPPALLAGTSTLAPMSRAMTPEEIQAFEVKYGYKPTELRIAIDAIGIFVNKSNTVPGLAIDDIDAIFSVGRKCGGSKEIAEWSALGGSAGKITMFGRNKESGTHVFFEKNAMCQGTFKPEVTEVVNSDEVIAKVAGNVNSIGYAGMGYSDPGVKALPIAKTGTKNFVAPTIDTIAKAEYPLSRFLYIYVNKAPGKTLPTNEKEFLRYVLSAEGQELVKKDGFVVLPDNILNKELTDILN